MSEPAQFGAVQLAPARPEFEAATAPPPIGWLPGPDVTYNPTAQQSTVILQVIIIIVDI